MLQQQRLMATWRCPRAPRRARHPASEQASSRCWCSQPALPCAAFELPWRLPHHNPGLRLPAPQPRGLLTFPPFFPAFLSCGCSDPCLTFQHDDEFQGVLQAHLMQSDIERLMREEMVSGASRER